MNMNTVYIMLGFIFIYAIVATIRDKRNKQNAKSKEAFNIAALRKRYFLNFADAKKLWEILKARK